MNICGGAGEPASDGLIPILSADCMAEGEGWRESAGKEKRGPISKQRNAHLHPVLIETAKLAPQFNETLKAVREKELTKGHANRATLAVARKLVAYLLAVDRAHFAELKKTKDSAMTAA